MENIKSIYFICPVFLRPTTVESSRSRERPKKNWENTVLHDKEDWNMTRVDPVDENAEN